MTWQKFATTRNDKIIYKTRDRNAISFHKLLNIPGVRKNLYFLAHPGISRGICKIVARRFHTASK